MTTSNQITSYVARAFPGLHAQASYHGANVGSVQVFDAASRLIADVDTDAVAGRYSIALRHLGTAIRHALAT